MSEPQAKPKRVNAAGYREAEDAVERYLNRYPDRKVEVFVQGKLAYVASVAPDPKAKRQ